MVTPQPPNRRIVELDALRALAAINLMLFHFTHVYSVKYGFSTPLGFEFPWGKYGVQLFFMLSGVVNALTLMKKRQPTDFLAARGLRILPSFYLVIGLNLLLFELAPLAAGPSWSLPQLLANLTLMPNLFGYECLEPVMWTLQIEVLFYGVLLLMFTRGWLERPLVPVLWGLGLCLIGRWWLDPVFATASPAVLGAWKLIREVVLLEYFPLFAVGILLHDGWRTPARRWSSTAGVAAALAVFHLTDQHHHNPVVSVGLAGLLAGSLYGRLPVLRWRPLALISSCSYMLYLLHDNLGAVAIHWMDRTLGLPPVACFLLALPGTVLIAALATWGVERPLSGFLRQRWRDFRESPSGTSVGMTGLAAATAGERR